MTSSSEQSLGAAHAPLRELVRDRIRERIVTGAILPGDRMIERELAAELGVSRIPIREAIRMLESEGFVTVVPRRGVVVRSLSAHDVRELFDVREALEVLAARRAAEHATPTELRALRATIGEADRALRENDVVAYRTATDRFHDEIIGLAHNDLLASMIEPLRARLHWLFRQRDDLSGLLDEHEQLLAAIEAGDPDQAAAEALTHVRTNREQALGLLFDDDADNGAAG